MRRALILVLLAASTVGCATLGPSPREQVMSDIEELKARVVDLQQKAAMSQVEIDRLRREVARLEAQLRQAGIEPVPAADRQRPAEPASLPRREAITEEEIADESPRGGVGEAAETGVEPGLPTEPLARPEGRAAGEASAHLGPAARSLYDRGYELFHQGRYLDAEASFRRFLEANPDTQLSDNALYWIGESRYAREDVRGALAAFREAVERYPEGSKVADSLLKIGQCLERLGDREGARESYEEVVRRFPRSAASAVAAQRLDGSD